MNHRNSTIALVALMSALSVILALFFIIPLPLTKGYVNLLEVGIYTSAVLFGRKTAGFVGGISGALLDLISGYPQWLLASAIIHGLQGAIAGNARTQSRPLLRGFSLAAASAVMIIGYFIASYVLYGAAAAWASLIGNLFQNLIGLVIAVPLAAILTKRLTSKRSVSHD